MADIELTDYNLLKNHNKMFPMHLADYRSYCPLFFSLDSLEELCSSVSLSHG